MIYLYRVKEKTAIFCENSYQTFHYLDAFKWDAIETCIRNEIISNNLKQIQKYHGKHKKATKIYEQVENLSLSVEIKPVNSALLEVLNITSDDSYKCYLDISVEERQTNDEALADTPAKPETTPMKERIGTPIPKLRRYPSRRHRFREDDDSEYKPTNNNNTHTVPEYVPSATGLDKKLSDALEYTPEPVNAAAASLHYTPSAKNGDGKRRTEELHSPVNLRSTKKKKADVISIESSISETMGCGKAGKKVQALFGDDSESDGKDDSPLTMEELMKKYNNMQTPEVQSGFENKPDSSRTTSTKTTKFKGITLKKGTSGRLQQTIEVWMKTKGQKTEDEAPQNPTPRTETILIDDDTANRIATLQKRTNSIVGEFKGIKEKNERLGEELNKKQTLKTYNSTLNFPHFTHQELEQKFKFYSNDLATLFKSSKKHQKLQASDLAQSVPGFVEAEVLDYINEIVQNNFVKDKDEFRNISRDSVISDLVVPEWVFMMFRDEYNLLESEARDRIKLQANNDAKRESQTS